jgi:hypothetical protein
VLCCWHTLLLVCALTCSTDHLLETVRITLHSAYHLDLASSLHLLLLVAVYHTQTRVTASTLLKFSFMLFQGEGWY